MVLKVESHTHKNTTAQKRSAAVTRITIPGLTGIANQRIVDSYGVDQTRLWRYVSGPDSGFEGYVEYDSGGHVDWLAYSGVYDPKCLEDTAVDSRRLQTYRPPAPSTAVAVFDYMIGPVTFEFDGTIPSLPTTAMVRIGFVGGNGGNPANRSPALPDENIVVAI